MTMIRRLMMADTTDFVIGSDVSCRDGACGELRRVVIDPVARALTHLVVESGRVRGIDRLVPIDLVLSTTEEISLRCTMAEFDALAEAEETHVLPEAGGPPGYEDEQTVAAPYYGLATDSMGMGSLGMSTGPLVITLDRVPAGKVEVQRGEPVHATDGTIGRVQGLVVELTDDHVTHVLLDEGHLWGEKRVAIPISAVANVDDGVRLTLTKDQVRDLPSIDLDQ
jgi:sporulation protein YlmC with PRC-barrel domain